LPSKSFEVTPYAWVYTDEELELELPNLHPTRLFPNLAANSPYAVQVRTRFLMYLPDKYAPTLNSPQGYYPKQAWQILMQEFNRDNFLEEAAPIITWLKMTLHATGNGSDGPPTNNLTMYLCSLGAETGLSAAAVTDARSGLAQHTPETIKNQDKAKEESSNYVKHEISAVAEETKRIPKV
jgi:hypothetical protein